MKDATHEIHENVGRRVAAALSDIDLGIPVNMRIAINNGGVTIDYMPNSDGEPREYLFGADNAPPPTAFPNQASESVRELAVKDMVRIRHGSGFLPEAGMIVSITTSDRLDTQYLVEYWINGEPKSEWLRAGHLEYRASSAAELQKIEEDEDGAAAIRHNARRSVRSAVKAAIASEDYGTSIVGECLAHRTLFHDIADAAAANGQVGSFTAYFRPTDDESAVAPEADQE